MFCLNVHRVARLGNNIMQLYQSLLFARQIGAKIVCVGSLRVFLFNPGFKRYVCEDGLVITRDGPPKKGFDVITERFFSPVSFGGHSFAPDLSLIPQVFQEIQTIMGIIPDQCGVSTDLHCHIRSGDIFTRESPKGNYVQPPLAFYVRSILDLLEIGEYKRVKVVYETPHNPVVQALLDCEQFGIPVVGQSSTLEQDAGEMMRASAIVMSRGSFVPMLSAVSGRTKDACFFLHPGLEVDDYLSTKTPYILEYFGTRMHNYSDDGTYIPRHSWKICSPDTEESLLQRKMLVDFPITSIIRVCRS